MLYTRLALSLGILVHAVAVALKTNTVKTENAEPAKYNTMLIVPEMKLLFCFIPKNSCTQFNKLMNALNDLKNAYGANCGPEDPNFRSKGVGKKTVNELNNITSDPTWTKAVFLRDPLERLVSAHRSKCEGDGDGLCHKNACLDLNFSRSIEKLASTENIHYVPQSRFCGGLDAKIQFYDYIGYVTKDYQSVHRQVKEMMKLVLQRNSGVHLPRLIDPSASIDPNSSHEEVVNTLIDRFFNSGEDKELQELPPDHAVKEYVNEFFPPHSSGDPALHTTSTNDGGKAYFTPNTAAAALKYYSADYLLPGLSVPDWAARMTR